METKTQQNTEPILIEFLKTVKAINLYPEGHPNLEAVFDKAFSEIKTLLLQFPGNITWNIDMKGFYEGDVPVGKTHKGLEGIAKEFFARRVKEITFSKDITPSELKAFLNILRIGADELKGLGGAEKALYDSGVKGIWVNEVPYDEMEKKLKEVTEEKKDSLDIVEGPEKEAAVELGEDAIEVMPEPPEEKPPAEEEQRQLSELLKKLDMAATNYEYETAMEEVLKKSVSIKNEGRLDELLPVMMTFANHAYFQPGRRDEQKAFAEKGILELATHEMTGHLVTRLCAKDEPKKSAIQKILLKVKGDAIDILLNKLIEMEDASIRKTIFNTLMLFGEDARTHAEAMLDDNRWFIVRQMTALLGAIGNIKSVERLRSVLKHKDARVKKEALKALARMHGEASREILIDIANNAKEKDIQLQAIASLGVLKDHASIPALMKLALKKEVFGGNIDVRKEAVKALSSIGDKKAVPALINILNSKAFFGKDKNLDLRCLAAAGLAKIGGEEAVKAVEEASKTAKGKLKEVCEEILKRRY